ncbi:MAG TPA: DNA gyrase inhibitor YacG [Gemmataceae bacterium]|jgi:hypothetical protein
MIQARCPICERSMTGDSAAEFPHLPFCSERCRRIDLGRWLGERYRIPGPDSSVPSADADDGSPGLLPPTGP